MNNLPKHYNLFLVTVRCDCGEEYVYPDVQCAREIPKGVAYSPLPGGAMVYDLPVNRKAVTHSVAFCSMCVERVPREPLPRTQPTGRVVSVARNLNGVAAPDSQAAEALLRQLGLL